MVFVTSRNATASLAKRLIEIAQEKGTLPLFEPEKNVKVARAGYKSGDLGYLVPQGFGIHHAGKHFKYKYFEIVFYLQRFERKCLIISQYGFYNCRRHWFFVLLLLKKIQKNNFLKINTKGLFQLRSHIEIFIRIKIILYQNQLQ